MGKEKHTGTAHERIYFRLDKRTRWMSLLILLVVGAGIALLFYVSGASYLPAWFSALIGAVVLLALISIPRFMHISPHSLEIHCTLELAKISFGEIKSMRYLEPSDMRYCFPLTGVYGFFGYFGYYVNPRTRRIFKVYGGQWRNFVMIETIYDQQIVICCPDGISLIAEIEKYTH